MPNYKRYYSNEYTNIFITMVTNKRQPLLIDNIQLLRFAFQETLKKYKFKIIAICVLPDHIHMIIEEPELKNYSNIISSIKKVFSHNINKIYKNNELSESRIKRKETGIWQRRFYEHTIRDEKDFCRHLDYIHYNPYKHYKIAPAKWEYSSFKKYVKMGIYPDNWCDFDNIDIDIE